MSRKINPYPLLICQGTVILKQDLSTITPPYLTREAPPGWGLLPIFVFMKPILLFPMLALLAASCSSPDQPNSENGAAQEIVPDNAHPLMRLLEQYPDSVALRLQLVNALDSAGSIRMALGQLDSLTKRDSGNYGLWYYQAQLLEKAGDTSRALQSYEQAVRIYAAPDAILSMANLLAERKDKQALVLCDEVEKLRLGREYHAHTHFIKGIFHARIAATERALEMFDQCIGNDYQYMEAYMEKGFIYFDRNDLTNAIQVFEKAIQIKPTYADACYWLGKCFEQQGQKDKAIVQYRQSLLLDPAIKEAQTALKRLGAA